MTTKQVLAEEIKMITSDIRGVSLGIAETLVLVNELIRTANVLSDEVLKDE